MTSPLKACKLLSLILFLPYLSIPLDPRCILSSNLCIILRRKDLSSSDESPRGTRQFVQKAGQLVKDSGEVWDLRLVEERLPNMDFFFSLKRLMQLCNLPSSLVEPRFELSLDDSTTLWASLFLKNFLAVFGRARPSLQAFLWFQGAGTASMAVLRPLVVASLAQTSGSRPAGISSWRHVALVVAAPGLQSEAQ